MLDDGATGGLGDLPDPGGGRRRQVVQAELGSKDEGVVTTIGEHTGDERGHGEVPGPDGSGPRSGRVGDRTEDVEGGRDSKPYPRGGSVPERGVELLGKQE